MWWWIIGGLVLYVLYSGTKSVKAKVVPSPGPHGYFLRTMKGPHLSGGALRFFTHVLEFPVVGPFLISLLFKTNFFHTLRNLQMTCGPTYQPSVHDFKKETDSSDISAEDFLQRENENVGKNQDSSSEKPVFTTVGDYARAYRKGDTTPSEVARKGIQALKENDKTNKPIRAIISLIESDVMQQATAADERFKSGKPLSIFDGVPITVKDEFDQKGYPTTCGTAYYNVVAQEDATVARKMRERGAILVGKSNMHEIGISTFGFNPHHGTPRNPYNLNHHTGGSSAGSAAAVGSGLVPVAVGADGGGSIRVPAALCGAVGLKATYGRVGEHGAFPLAWTVAHAGPIANNVRDCALAYAALAGEDSHDPFSQGQPPVTVPNFSELSNSQPLKGMRIGIYSEYFNHADPEIVKSCRAAVEILTNLGGTLLEVPVLPGLLEYARVAHTIVITSEMGASISPFYGDLPTRKRMGLDVRISLGITSALKGKDYVQANRIRTLAIESVKELFSSVDILVTPTTAQVAPRITTPDAKEDLEIAVVGNLMRYAFLANFTGIPGISLPCGYTPEGLPIGFQIMGRWWDESTLLKVAYVLEQQLQKKNTPQKLFTHL
eukprot:Phypoly_transcript_04941.p1 GENE.Phypoly_transcript_04941~~Phypoly_transcript_04941.p1  ORF type:complete len:606 (+),score=113.87 Phypoly_transcript_04941:197-2014(+)